MLSMTQDKAMSEFRETMKSVTQAVIEQECAEEYCNRTGRLIIKESIEMVSELYKTGMFVQYEIPHLIFSEKDDLTALWNSVKGKIPTMQAVDMVGNIQ